MKRGSPERSVQVTLKRWLQLVLPAGSIIAAVKNEHAPRSEDPNARARFFAKRKAEGVLAGTPDLACWLPEGRTLLVEVKAPGGVVSETQTELHAKLRALGHTVIVATSIETCRGALLDAGFALREAAGQAVAVTKVRVAKARNRLVSDEVPF